jgi:hypothetical protein
MTHHRLFRQLALAALLLGLAPFAPPAAAQAAQPAHITSIAAARHLPLGTVVTIAGLASAPSDAFESSFFDKGFGLQDQTAGIFVSLQENLHVQVRRQATVTGKLQDASGLLVIVPASPADVHLGGIGAQVIPEWVTTGAIGETTEGRLVLVIGRITTAVSSDLPFGYKLGVDDGSGEVQIFINTQTGIDVSHLALNQLVSITGFSSQFETHYEIDPRRPADITGPAF